ncbi:hypothetical protein EEL33_08860 [Muribaculaceae bacterium Isolate-037 (Harlan)]|jgi:hypothetical protein|uniref:hypothetical protein n=1 Tax=Bacteroidales TaxID=171549 RepID=UPI000D1DE0E2|nr:MULTISPECIES: hypothetical protein [Bacteroidales]ROS85976.1 hypothetical protein EEL39_14630 [Muribaculaceae bacterium Isolate-080 (Janvier)]ROS92377.1 hypothetical protein EEL36_09135 [Muribaculaceae bacterium Isolate-043 (Harlan)]ROT06868.1 hypothetical protein EEL33_08860 [Muribaculaceae bacterium Isolate-037 (Harlan)]PWB05589.1 hypothetical protein C5O24_11195 [Paramuribaculum intestinale]WLT41084.1 hypothetical protein NF347_08805 [Paramuribaculum intestinale]
MDDDGIQYIKFMNEECRLRYLIDKYKEHDKKRNRYIAHLLRMNDQQAEKIKRLEALSERQHEEIDELMDAYDGAKPLIADKAHRAYVYELIKRANEAKKNRRVVEKLTTENTRLSEENKGLKDRVKALETIIKNLHNGTKQ